METNTSHRTPIDNSLVGRSRRVVRDLRSAIASRAASETALATESLEKAQSAEDVWTKAQADLKAKLESQLQQAENALKEAKQRFGSQRGKEFETLRSTLSKSEADMQKRHAVETEQLKKEYEESRWSSKTLYEGNKNSTQETHRSKEHQARSAIGKLKDLLEQAKNQLAAWKQDPEQIEVPRKIPEAKPNDNPQATIDKYVQEGEQQLINLHSLVLPKISLWWIFAILGIALSALTVWVLTNFVPIGLSLLMGIAAGGVITFAIALSMNSIARWQASKVCDKLMSITAKAMSLEEPAVKQAEAEAKKELKRLQEEKNIEIENLDNKYVPLLRKQKGQFENEVIVFNKDRDDRLENLQRIVQKETSDIVEADQKKRAALDAAYQKELAAAQERYQHDCVDVRNRQISGYNEMANTWKRNLASIEGEAAQIRTEAAALSPDWNIWKSLPEIQGVAPINRIGTLHIDIAKFPNGLPADPKLREETHLKFDLPALIAFPTPGNVLLKASQAGRAAAVQVLQSLMFRYLTSLPAAKSKMTIFDAVGLGDSFAGFMHLSDFDESLINYRIWTEETQFEQKLVDLTGHMESIIQKYLRNQYPTIEAYNADAGEVAEPFRLLVVANYPVNFSTDTARRLVSIASSGARCGVVSLISVDTSQPVPRETALTDLEAVCTVFEWKEDHFIWQDKDFSDIPLSLLPPPEDKRATDLIKHVGDAAKHAQRVEVPFRLIHPAAEQQDLWQNDTSHVISIPMGRVGATRRQRLELGKGTSQHAIVAGKTGSGKSTLLNVLVTNGALHYSPDQLQFYLVDFKKGVEFKPYATYALPHARVVAVESEREFGLSVLQKLDEELKQRGDKFRSLGVTNVADARKADPKMILPRILLIVDEFQEFFVEDDKLAQEAALLMDRLVRQGRAFGMHIILGSQTLGGAYSMSRSTLDQMAVRIVLACSESDGHFVLGDDNHAARLLSRPGDAIYNDASGRVEGNHPFQVCWLDDEEREKYLEAIRTKYEAGKKLDFDPIVFEGNAPAEMQRSRVIKTLAETKPTEAPKVPAGLLGEAIAIKDASTVSFLRQSGSHLLLVGQDENAAAGVFSGLLASLALQFPTGAAQFSLLSANFDQGPGEALQKVASVLPQAIDLGSYRQVPQKIAGLAEEYANRKAAPPETSFPPTFVFVFGMHRLRDLRRSDDDFSFGGGGGGEGTIAPVTQFNEMVKEGSALGMHFILWADTHTGTTRSLERQALRECGMKALFQMSANDSSNLIDSPAAGKLGQHRGLLFCEDRSSIEKFRPFGLPDQSTLDLLAKAKENR